MSQFRKIVETILKEMSYPTDFDLNYFSTIRTFKDRVNYCKDRLKLLGNGSSRIAFQVDNEKVLKIAKNSKGIVQNMKEEDWGRNQYGCFAIIYHADEENHTWLEMELAHKATKQDFIECFGISIEELNEVIQYIRLQYSNDNSFTSRQLLSNEKLKNFIEQEIYTENNIPLYQIYHYMLDYQPDRAAIADWKQIRNWGVVNRDGKKEVVIIDDGFDETIHKDFYSK